MRSEERSNSRACGQLTIATFAVVISVVRHHVHLAFHAGDVEPGQDAERGVGLIAPDVDPLQLAVRHQVAMGDLRRLGSSGGAGGVLQQSGIARSSRYLAREWPRVSDDLQKWVGVGGRRRWIEEIKRRRQDRLLGKEIAIRAYGRGLEASLVSDRRHRCVPAR